MADYRGKWLLIYFGYTFCPDVCPATLTDLGDALKALGPRGARVRALFAAPPQTPGSSASDFPASSAAPD